MLDVRLVSTGKHECKLGNLHPNPRCIRKFPPLYTMFLMLWQSAIPVVPVSDTNMGSLETCSLFTSSKF